MSLRLLPALLCVAALGGCKRAGPPPVLSAAECDRRASALGEWLALLEEESNYGGCSSPFDMVKTELPARKLPLSGSLRVWAGGISYDEKTQPLEATSSVADDLLSHFKESERTRRDATSPRELGLLVAPDIRWKHLRAILAMARGLEVEQIVFVVEGRSRLTAPPPAYNTEWMRQASRGRCVDGAGFPSGARPGDPWAACKEAAQAAAIFETLANSSASEAPGLLPEAARGCGCRVDFDAVKNAQWALYGRFDGSPEAHFTIRLQPLPPRPSLFGDEGIPELRASGGHEDPEALRAHLSRPASPPRQHRARSPLHPDPARLDLPEAATWSEIWQGFHRLSQSDRPLLVD